MCLPQGLNCDLVLNALLAQIHLYHGLGACIDLVRISILFQFKCINMYCGLTGLHKFCMLLDFYYHTNKWVIIWNQSYARPIMKHFSNVACYSYIYVCCFFRLGSASNGMEQLLSIKFYHFFKTHRYKRKGNMNPHLLLGSISLQLLFFLIRFFHHGRWALYGICPGFLISLSCE